MYEINIPDWMLFEEIDSEHWPVVEDYILAQLYDKAKEEIWQN